MAKGTEEEKLAQLLEQKLQLEDREREKRVVETARYENLKTYYNEDLSAVSTVELNLDAEELQGLYSRWARDGAVGILPEEHYANMNGLKQLLGALEFEKEQRKAAALEATAESKAFADILQNKTREEQRKKVSFFCVKKSNYVN